VDGAKRAVAAVCYSVTCRFGAKPSSITAAKVAKLREQESK
jgi:hypothetical protein